MRQLSLWTRSRVSHRSLAAQTRLQLEGLESRVVPYATSGNAWLPYTANGVNYNLSPQLLRISFVPDGTNLGGASSNLFSTFNAKFGSAATWQNVILKAAQVWAQQTNLNFAVVADSGAAEGSGSYQQGDPTMGDIRISGYNFNSSTLAEAYMPPPVDNYSVAGDIQFNTGQTFNINGQNYDLFTVAAHEFGHALGLEHSSVTGAVMYGTYGSVHSALASDDIAGIRNIYSNNNPRSTDVFGSLNNSFSNAANINSYIDPNSLTALVNTMDITTAGEKDYYTATAPSGTGSTVTISVQSQGLSLLAPKLYVYSAGQTLLGSSSGYGKYGTTLTLNLTNQISANQQFYVEVTGADSTAFGTGAYALTMSFAGNSLPTVPLPNTQVANGNPLSGGGGEALSTKDHDLQGDKSPVSDAGQIQASGFTPQAVQFLNLAVTTDSLPSVTVVVQPSTTRAAQTEAAELEATGGLSRRDAYFAGDSSFGTPEAALPAGTAGADGAEWTLNPVTQAAALDLVLGSY